MQSGYGCGGLIGEMPTVIAQLVKERSGCSIGDDSNNNPSELMKGLMTRELRLMVHNGQGIDDHWGPTCECADEAWRNNTVLV